MGKLRKGFIFLVLILLFSYFSGCGLVKEMFKTELISNEGEIKLIINEEYQKYFPYEVPSFTLEFEGSFNTTKNRGRTRNS